MEKNETPTQDDKEVLSPTVEKKEAVKKAAKKAAKEEPKKAVKKEDVDAAKKARLRRLRRMGRSH